MRALQRTVSDLYPGRGRVLATLGFCLAGMLFAGCAVNPVTGQQNLVLMSESEEISVGRQYHPKILQQYGRYADEALQSYVQQVGTRLAENSHRPELVYRFTVLDSTDVNAFALPGGYIYITRGLMAYLDSEAELAAVLGHEIGHVTARHGVRQQSAAQVAGAGMVVAQILLPELRAGAAEQLYSVLSQAILSGYGREHELESDRLGAEYLARTGYPPQSMLGVLRVLKAQEAYAAEVAEQSGQRIQTYHGLFATHPDNDRRLQEVVSEALPLYAGVEADERRGAYLKKIDGMVFGDSPAQGVRRGNRFFHEQLGIAVTFPEHWHLSNQPQQVVSAHPGGEATLVMLADDINRKIPPERFLTERLGLQVTAGTELQGDLPGYTGRARVRTGQGEQLARVSVLYVDQTAYLFVGLVRDTNALANFEPAFLDAARSLHRLTDEERAAAQPLRIALVRAEAGTTYAALAERSPLTGLVESQLRLLNQHYPQGDPESGQWLKVVR